MRSSIKSKRVQLVLDFKRILKKHLKFLVESLHRYRGGELWFSSVRSDCGVNQSVVVLIELRDRT